MMNSAMEISEAAEALLQEGPEGIDNVPNLRDLHSVSPLRIKPGCVYRCSCLFDESHVKDLGIKKIIDLRRKDDPPVVPSAHRILVPMVDNYTGIQLLNSFSIGFKIRLFLLWPCRGFIPQITYHLFENSSTITNYYNVMFDYAKAPIRISFLQLANPENYPLLIHCVAGKDRTGLIVALLLRLCDVPYDEVIDDYVLSGQRLLMAVQDEDQKRHEALLNPHTMKSPREAMAQSLMRLEKRHGSVRNYLQDYIGIDPETLDRVRELVMVQD